MQASAFQQLHNENVALHKHVNQLETVNQQLQVLVQQKHREVHGEKVSNVINVLAAAVYATERQGRRWWHRFAGKAAARAIVIPTTASLTVPQSLIDEVANRPYAYASTLSKDEATGTQTMTVTRKPQAEIDQIEAQLKAQAETIQAAQREAQAKAATPPVVGLDGQTPARETAGKILTVAR